MEEDELIELARQKYREGILIATRIEPDFVAWSFVLGEITDRIGRQIEVKMNFKIKKGVI